MRIFLSLKVLISDQGENLTIQYESQMLFNNNLIFINC